ncbi:oxidative damage protection protein [Advenella kashmirensis WT001]|uniref:Probable Fe(2+)-trafficking protein n=1 Tax=Advenella kashmirensis (strain DSM 17095 / LMG 22695 / WT001) TaxID=1036672 RepID=I3UDK5_ADVKW|nr:oxidative damage protection protein [Advenella kashmirensis WT001]
MARMIQCIKLKKEAEGLDYPPYPGELGTKIWNSISKEAWQQWTDIQTRIVNENRLNLADARARKYLQQQMESFLFDDVDVEAQATCRLQPDAFFL